MRRLTFMLALMVTDPRPLGRYPMFQKGADAFSPVLHSPRLVEHHRKNDLLASALHLHWRSDFT
jgi:hypothetical protein